MKSYKKDLQYYKFCGYGFLKNMEFYDPFLIIFFRQQGLSFLEIGTLYAIREVAINVLEIPSGFLADIFGRKRALLIAFGAYILSFLVFYLFRGYGWFVLAFLLYGIGDASRTGTHKAMILSYLKRNGWEQSKTDYYGHTRAWSQRGSAISALIGALIVFLTGRFDLVFLFAIVPYLLDFLLVASYPDYLNGQIQSLQEMELKQEFKQKWMELKQSFTQFEIFRVITNTSVYTGFYKGVRDYLQPILVTLSLSLPFFTSMDDDKRLSIVVGVVYFFIYLATSRASASAGKVQNLMKEKITALNWLLYIGLLMGVASGIAYNFNWTWLSVLFFAGILIIQNLRRPVAMSYLTDCFDERVMATALSTESQFETVFAAMIAPLIGLMADLLGAGTAILGVSVAMLLLFSVFRIRRAKADL
jgi:MFS family permease